MTQDEIIEMARQAWDDANEGWVAKDWFDDRAKALEAFAKLVAAKEREACAKVCYELPWKDMTQIPSNLAFAAAIRARGEA
jgi:hypothetical protein